MILRRCVVPRLFDSITFLQNAGHYSPEDTASHLRRPRLSSVILKNGNYLSQVISFYISYNKTN